MTDILETPVSADLVGVEVNPQRRDITITLHSAFLRALAEPTNRAEKQLVIAIIRGISTLNGLPLPTAQLLETIAPNDQARFAHLFMARTVRDELSDLPLDPSWLVADHDSYNAALGVATDLKLPGRHTLNGKAESQHFLHAAVDTLWQRIRRGLRRYNRALLIKTVLQNLEAVAADDDVWHGCCP